MFDPVLPTAEQWETMTDPTEVDIESTEPLETWITYSLEGHVLSLTVDGALNLLDVTEHDGDSA